MANRSILEYWNGSAWVEETNMIQFSLSDTLQSTMTVTVTIGNFSDSALNTKEANFGKFTKIRIKEGETDKYIFYGKVMVVKPARDSFFGHTVTLDAVDNLRELSTNDVDADITGHTTRSSLISSLISTNTWSGNIGVSDSNKFLTSVKSESSGVLDLTLTGSRKKVFEVIKELAAEDLTTSTAKFGYDFFLDIDFNGNTPTPDFNYFPRGSIPASLPSGGLTLEYAPSTGQTDQIMPIAGDYSFPLHNSELITRVKSRFVDTAGNNEKARKLDMILINHGATSGGNFAVGNIITWGSNTAKVHYVGSTNTYLIIGPSAVDDDDKPTNTTWLNTISGQSISVGGVSATVSSATANPPGSLREAIDSDIDVNHQSYEISTELEAASHAASVLYNSGDSIRRGKVSTYQFPRYRVSGGAWVPIRAGHTVYVKSIPSDSGISNQNMVVTSIQYDEGAGLRTCSIELMLTNGRGTPPIIRTAAVRKNARDSAAVPGANQAGIKSRSGLSWSTTVTFSPDGTNGHNTVDWSSGNLIFFDGTTYAISAGTTGTISDITYIYFSKSSSTTTLAYTTSATTAAGADNIILATCEDVASGGKVTIETNTGVLQKNYYSLDTLFDGATYKRATQATIDGGARANTGLDASGFLSQNHFLSALAGGSGIAFKSSDSTTAVAFTSAGIIGANSGTTQFQIQATDGKAGFGGLDSGVFRCVADSTGFTIDNSAADTTGLLIFKNTMDSASTHTGIYKANSGSLIIGGGVPGTTTSTSAPTNISLITRNASSYITSSSNGWRTSLGKDSNVKGSNTNGVNAYNSLILSSHGSAGQTAYPSAPNGRGSGILYVKTDGHLYYRGRGITGDGAGSSGSDEGDLIPTADSESDELQLSGSGSGSGDITGVVLTGDDSGTAIDNTGQAVLTIAGGTDITTSGANTTLTVTHDSGAGSKHIPAGGSSGQVLVYSSSGTATWGSGGSGENNENSFKYIAVSGQDTVTADSTTDTLTFVASTGISLTTDNSADSISIHATGTYIEGVRVLGGDGIQISSNGSSFAAPSQVLSGDVWLRVDTDDDFGWSGDHTFSEPVLFDNGGSAAAPGISFVADTNTGIYRSDADEISFTCNGSDDLIIANNLITIPTSTFVVLNSLSTSGTSDVYRNADSKLSVLASTRRIKQDIRPLAFDTSKIWDIDVKSYEVKKSELHGNTLSVIDEIEKTDFGLIAEELYEVAPELVTLDDGGEPISILNKNLIMVLLAETKKLRARVALLEGN